MIEWFKQIDYKKYHKTLAFKVSTFMVSVLVFSLLIFSFIFAYSARSQMKESILKNGIIFANFSTNIIYSNYVQYYSHSREEDFENFKTNINSILSNDADVEKVSLIGINGRILFDSSELNDGKYSGTSRNIDDAETLKMLASDETSSRNIAVNGVDYTEVVVPISTTGSHLFSVRYLLSNSSLSTKMSSIYKQLTILFLVLVILTAIMSIVFTIKLVEPVVTLTKTVAKIQEGNLDVKSDIKTEDEIGLLAKTFNEMTAKLKESYTILEEKVKQRTIELETERGSLETKVKERTSELQQLKDSLEETVSDRTKTLAEKIDELERLNKLMVGRELKMIELKEELDKLRGQNN